MCPRVSLSVCQFGGRFIKQRPMSWSVEGRPMITCDRTHQENHGAHFKFAVGHSSLPNRRLARRTAPAVSRRRPSCRRPSPVSVRPSSAVLCYPRLLPSPSHLSVRASFAGMPNSPKLAPLSPTLFSCGWQQNLVGSCGSAGRADVGGSRPKPHHWGWSVV